MLDDPGVCKSVAYALGEIGDKRALEPLKNALEMLERLGGFEHERKALKEVVKKIQRRQD
ncbi:MAG: hypothetical protein DRO00_06480 [Thermoproteota archaeon]|nr:MAG: hypothetical protein DRO00_06480 [Candidatus Korarchaeota archaeon]